MKKQIVRWPFSVATKKKVMLAFEFAVVLADAAHQLNLSMTREMVAEAEKLLEKELMKRSAHHFAMHMNVYALAILKPKD